MTILPLTYSGNTEYFRRLLSGSCVIDPYENYVKQSYRNRCEILTAVGVASLTVNVVKGGSILKRPVREIRIDYSRRWQHQHWMSIVSAYGNSPYFDHYRSMFEPFYRKEFTFLADLNTGLLETAIKILGKGTELNFSRSYIEAGPDDEDLRPIFEPSAQKHFPNFCQATPYEQVFSDRTAFQPNLSVIDLIFCEGPEAANLLTRT